MGRQDAAEAEANVQLERTDCGGSNYCTPDERFWVRRLWREENGRLIKPGNWRSRTSPANSRLMARFGLSTMPRHPSSVL